MPKEEWGVKRLCPSCSIRFYDLQMDPMTCPGCGASFTVDSLSESKPKSLRPEKAKEKAPVAEKAPVVEETEDLEDDNDIDDDLLDDDDETVPLEEIADVSSEKDDD